MENELWYQNLKQENEFEDFKQYLNMNLEQKLSVSNYNLTVDDLMAGCKKEKKTPEQLLRKLLKHFYQGYYGNLFWKYAEGTSLEELEGKQFENELIKYLSKEQK